MEVSRLLAAPALGAALIATSAFAQENPVQVQHGNEYGIVNVADYIALLPEQSKKVIEDQTIVRRPDAGVRVFRLYDRIPQHYHLESDAYLYILSGKARFKVGDAPAQIAGAGDLLFWGKGVEHGNPEIIEGPVDVLVFDAPSRDPSDVVWMNPTEAPDFLAD